MEFKLKSFILNHHLVQEYIHGTCSIIANHERTIQETFNLPNYSPLASSLYDGETFISPGRNFALGFFTPANSNNNNNNRYVDIWYNKIAGHTVMWVANRHHPINSTAGILSITTNGSLVITNGNSTTNRNLTGWSSSTDPFPGNYTLTVDRRDAPQLIFWAGSFRVWRSGPWTGVTPFNDPYSTVTSSFNFVRKKEEVSYSVGVVNNSILTRLLVDPSGTQRADRIST